MSVSKMQKLTVIATMTDADAIIQRLMKLRAVSIEKASDGESKTVLDSFAPHTDVGGAAARVARVEAVLPVLAKHSRRKKKLFAAQAPISPEAYRTDGRFDTAWKVVEETHKILNGQAECRAQKEAVIGKMNAYRPYLSLEFAPDFAGTETSGYLVGSLPGSTRFEKLTEQLSDIAALPTLLSADGTGLYLTLVYHRAEEEKLLRTLSALGFMRAPLPPEKRTVAALYKEAEAELEELEAVLSKLEARLSILADKLGEIEILWDVERTALLAEENKRELAATKQCVVLRGWCPQRERERITALLSVFAVAYEFAEPDEGDDVPILLKNNGFAKNFEWVLGMYAYPKYGSFDPTLIMSVFYFLIFGLMFADAGYGVLLSLVCFGVVHWCHPKESMKRFLSMFGYCGISCAIFGVLFGAYFGDFPLAFMQNMLGRPIEALPRLSILPAEAANVAILFDPIQNPMVFLIIALAVGALHLIAGMAVKAYILCREGKIADALFDIVAYWILFAGIGMIFVAKTAGIIVLSVGAGTVLLTAGRHKKGIAGKILGGFLGLYDLINFASDLLSYSRILALGLAAGIIAQVVNLLATLNSGFIGFLLMIVIFAFGHLLNLAINLLGTFVHTSRLQYIEFFNKFYESGGTPFRPMAPSDRYVKDVSHEIDTSPATVSADMTQD
ncbi:MAG: hypothetical protein E7585_01665 [Ruminococcaceae bacterium]|nr:hypothetical protein [Oscillospiraceae bacterium]